MSTPDSKKGTIIQTVTIEPYIELWEYHWEKEDRWQLCQGHFVPDFRTQLFFHHSRRPLLMRPSLQSSQINGSSWFPELPKEEYCSGYEQYYRNSLIMCCLQLLLHETLFIIVFTGHLAEQMPYRRIRKEGGLSDTDMYLSRHVLILLRRKWVLHSCASAVAEIQMW